jgi:hypothetical protein
MTPELRTQLLDLLPKGLHARLAIAGGYAADPDKAEDIDLWVLDIAVDDFDGVEQAIRRHLVNDGKLVCEERPHSDSIHYEEHVGHFRVVSVQNAEIGDGKWSRVVPVQIILTKQPTLQHLLEQFDISSHALGYMVQADPEFGDSVMVFGEGYTSFKCQPRVLSFDRPEQTLPRIEKIAQRYGFEPLAADIKQLKEAV